MQLLAHYFNLFPVPYQKLAYLFAFHTFNVVQYYIRIGIPGRRFLNFNPGEPKYIQYGYIKAGIIKLLSNKILLVKVM